MSKTPVKGNWLDKATLVKMREQFELNIDYFYEDLTGPNKEVIIQNNEKLKKNIRYIDDILHEFADEDKELYTKYGDNYKIFYCKGKLLLKIGNDYYQKKSRVVY